LLENFILNELRDLGFSIKYWRTSGKAEVDFIVELQNQLVPIEVKSFGKIKRGFLSFINTYNRKMQLFLLKMNSLLRESITRE
jgi:predicted AAA+ superfamily ATPase